MADVLTKSRKQYAVRWVGGEVANRVFSDRFAAEQWADQQVMEILEDIGAVIRYVVVSRTVTTSTSRWENES